MRRVVVTGIGAVTPIGNDVPAMWESVKNGVCGIDKVTHFDVSGYKTQIAGEVKNLNVEDFIERKEVRKMDRYAQFALIAATEAVKNSGLDMTKEDPWRVGVVTGSGIGGITTFEEQHENLMAKGPGRACHIAIKFGAKGVNENVVTACASGTNALGDAFRHIQYGANDVIITGGAEAAVSPTAFAGFCNMKAMSTRNDDPKHASRPFDAERDGFVLSEGAGMLVLEELEHAKKRGANIICEVVGYGATDDAYHITSPIPGGEGGAMAMKLAIKDAGVSPDEIDYINAHGTSTKYNDHFETEAIKEALGDGYIPATINYENPDPDCDLDIVPNKGRNGEIRYAMSNSLGFGGHNATVVLKKYED